MSDNNNYLRDFINSIDDNDNVKANTDFNSEMQSRISDALEIKRVEVANTLTIKPPKTS